MKKEIKFTKDVYEMSFVDFEKFVKSKFPKLGNKKIKELYQRHGNNLPVQPKIKPIEQSERFGTEIVRGDKES